MEALVRSVLPRAGGARCAAAASRIPCQAHSSNQNIARIKFARDRIRQLGQRGLTVVAETDVRRFFDDVDWWRIETRLRALFGDDPLVAQIMRWVQAGRSDGIARTQGLPEGAPLSPLLQNLMLDHLDTRLLERSPGTSPCSSPTA